MLHFIRPNDDVFVFVVGSCLWANTISSSASIHWQRSWRYVINKLFVVRNQTVDIIDEPAARLHCVSPDRRLIQELEQDFEGLRANDNRLRPLRHPASRPSHVDDDGLQLYHTGTRLVRSKSYTKHSPVFRWSVDSRGRRRWNVRNRK